MKIIPLVFCIFCIIGCGESEYRIVIHQYVVPIEKQLTLLSWEVETDVVLEGPDNYSRVIEAYEDKNVNACDLEKVARIQMEKAKKYKNWMDPDLFLINRYMSKEQMRIDK